MKSRIGLVVAGAAAFILAIGVVHSQFGESARYHGATADNGSYDHISASSPAISVGGRGANARSASSGSFAANSPAESAGEDHAKLTLASLSDSQVDRYLVKNDVISLEAKEVRQAADQAEQISKLVGGYVSGSHESTDSLGLRNETLEVRVPSDRFEDTMHRIEGLGRVLDNQVSSEDVTEQYVDTDAQVRNLKQTESRLLSHLSRTGSLSDTLRVETELSRVRESLNELEGKLRFMSHRVTYSTISVTLKEPAHIEPITPAESFSVGQVVTQAMRSVTGSVQSLIAACIWILMWSVFWAPLAALGLYIYARQRRRMRLSH